MTESELLNRLRENPFVLAPMAGITDCAFRSFMKEMGAGVVVTELVSATGFKYSPEKTKRIMAFERQQSPIGIQLFGENLEHLSEAARAVEQMGADFVDLNFGCPVPKVVNKGAGSACLKDLSRLRDTIRSVKSAVGIPVTIKVRTGWDEKGRNTDQVVRVAHDEGVTWVAIHGRTRAAGYSGLADWDYIAQVKAESPLPVIGNGDIHTARQAVDRLRTSGCDAVMIGRGALKNFEVFRESLALWKAEQPQPFKKSFVVDRLRNHLEAAYDERYFLIQLRKFAAWYSSGYPSAAAFRKNLYANNDRTTVVRMTEDFFAGIENVSQIDTSGESFLMGGHG